MAPHAKVRHGDHLSRVAVGAVDLVQDRGVLVAYRFSCQVCDAPVEVDGDARVLSLLHAFGLAGAAVRPATRPSADRSGVHRSVVSLRALLDDPAMVAGWLDDRGVRAAPGAPDRTTTR